MSLAVAFNSTKFQAESPSPGLDLKLGGIGLKGAPYPLVVRRAGSVSNRTAVHIFRLDPAFKFETGHLDNGGVDKLLTWVQIDE